MKKNVKYPGGPMQYAGWVGKNCKGFSSFLKI